MKDDSWPPYMADIRPHISDQVHLPPSFSSDRVYPRPQTGCVVELWVFPVKLPLCHAHLSQTNTCHNMYKLMAKHKINEWMNEFMRE